MNLRINDGGPMAPRGVRPGDVLPAAGEKPARLVLAVVLKAQVGGTFYYSGAPGRSWDEAQCTAHPFGSVSGAQALRRAQSWPREVVKVQLLVRSLGTPGRRCATARSCVSGGSAGSPHCGPLAACAGGGR